MGTANGTNDTSVVPLIIGGKDVVGSEPFPVINPATGEEIWNAGGASLDQASQAVEAAEAAFPTWSKSKASFRRDLFLKAADLFQERYNELVKYQQLETGADPNFVNWILPLTIENLKEVAGKCSMITGTYSQSTGEGRGALVLKEPYGVVLGIAPW